MRTQRLILRRFRKSSRYYLTAIITGSLVNTYVTSVLVCATDFGIDLGAEFVG